MGQVWYLTVLVLDRCLLPYYVPQTVNVYYIYMYISLQHLYFQENCKSDGAKLIEIEDSAEENLIDDGPLYGIFVCFECVTAKSTYMFFC